MKIVYQGMVITGPYSELRDLFLGISQSDVEEVLKAREELKRMKGDIADMRRTVSLVARVAEELNNNLLTSIEKEMWGKPTESGPAMFACLSCGDLIDGKTDDNYNREHSKIQCPKCGTWRPV